MAYAGYNDPYELLPAAQAPVTERVSYMRQVGVMTFGSLLITAFAAVVVHGCGEPDFGASEPVGVPCHHAGRYLWGPVRGQLHDRQPQCSTRTAGFVIGSALSGTALSYLLLSAGILGYELFGNPFVLVGQAGMLVGLTVLGMVAYLMTGPRQLSMVASMMSMLTLPMLGLMAFTWFFPVGGTLGLVFSAIFVVVSAGGLLYSLNEVLHNYSTDMVTAGAFRVSSGIVVLFWNILVLLMRLQRD